MDFGAFLTQKNRVFAILTIVSFILFRCGLGNVPESKRLYRKKITFGDQSISWFYFSNISTTTPDLLILESENCSDTICEVSNLRDIKLKENELTLFFSGTPRLYQNSILLPTHVRNLEIKVDKVMFQIDTVMW